MVIDCHDPLQFEESDLGFLGWGFHQSEEMNQEQDLFYLAIRSSDPGPESPLRQGKRYVGNKKLKVDAVLGIL